MDCHSRVDRRGCAEIHVGDKAGSHILNPLAIIATASGQFIVIAAGALSRRIGRFSFPRNGWLSVFLCLFLLTGCTSRPDSIPPIVFSVVLAIWKLRKLSDDRLLRDDSKGNFFEKGITDVGNHVKFFLRCRVETYLKTNSNEDSVTQLVAAEYDRIKAFASDVIGLDPSIPKPLIRGTDDFPHLDFTDVKRILTTTPAIDSIGRSTQEDKRWNRAMTIIWRAAALEIALWDPAINQSQFKAALKEILDRRLRITERMLYQISIDITRDLERDNIPLLTPSAAVPHGPWPTPCRVRMFEYPFLDSSYAGQIGTTNIGEYGQPDLKIWRKDQSGGLLYYTETGGRRIRNAAANAFVTTPGLQPDGSSKYTFDLLPTVQASAAIDLLFAQSSDWWDRSWLYCDHVVSALHLEALRFGKRRRTASDSEFDTVLSQRPQGWAQLRPLLPGDPLDRGLMADDNQKRKIPAQFGGPPNPPDPLYFARGAMPKVQLGDHIVFWNSILYGLLSDGAWSLENAVVIETKSNWESNDVGDTISLMGHGTGETYAGRFREELTSALNGRLKAARDRANASGTAVSVPWIRRSAPLVRWAPYGEAWTNAQGQPQAPWWIRIPFDKSLDWDRALGEAGTLGTLPDAVKYDPSYGFTSAPPTVNGLGPNGAAYFPLYVPPQQNTWTGYINRRSNGNVPSSFVLEPHRFHGNNIPAFAVPAQFLPAHFGQPPAGSRQVLTVRPIVAP